MVAAKKTTREGKKMNLNPKYKYPKHLLQKGKLDDSPLVIAFEKKHAQTERERKNRRLLFHRDLLKRTGGLRERDAMLWCFRREESVATTTTTTTMMRSKNDCRHQN